MNTLPLSASALRRGQTVLLAVLALAVALLGALALPAERADAMEAVKCTGRPNSEDDPTVIMGATESRITFEASVAEGEGVTSLTLCLPEGTGYSNQDLSVTLLTGDDLMTRNELDYTETMDGQGLTLDFAEPITQAGHLNVMIYDVFFPAEGGEMQLEATYELADGTEKDIEGIPSIPVEGISTTESLSQWLEEQPWVQAWNSNRFLHLFFDPALLVTSFPVVLTGFFMSVSIVAVAFPLAIPMGLLLALMRISKPRLLRGIATTYVNIVRGTPLFLQIYVAFFGLPLAGIQIPNFVLGVTVMCMNSGAYMCEIFRAGILSISKGQTEAARSLGMNGAQTMFYVILPQMFRIVIPNLTSEFIVLYKDTSLLAAVGIMELVMYARTIVASTGSITPYIVAALFYLVITLPLSKVTRHLEDRVRGHRTRKHAVEPEAASEEGASHE
ncbi:amino acid ABC transporter permease [Olsenella sp. An270]|uniref:amino acid ABC transporter permease n=1 Tax=Olsenella sp. An270 TaxID=1965615 RepID=UPI000B367E1A|nr:amino acid ABC transporter permease [Olsenella sp. An270]OUO60285.1 amino acid ABC transporter permease [Olsenella sp. An270]